ncbi:MAG: OPT/YSL family transporter [Puniceicoccales bacterium]|jgi:uncharacterized oligopeptide transporter (OPT) family protein|nr:OPT/YSL family transporter [Puniceicoccales bacterium]
MALHELTPEQTRTWSREQKDRWWLENVFRGNLPQLTWRSAATGFLLGGALSATNLYIGAKSGTTLGVGLTSVILAFAFFKLLSRAGARDFTILENNAMQSIATAAGYMTSPLIASLAALMLLTEKVIPWWQMILWNVIISIIGVLVAFPLKRRFINEEQLPFPEGRACGVVLDTLYTDKGGEGLFKARVLAIAAGVAAAWQFLISEGWQRLVQFKLLGLTEGAELVKGKPVPAGPWHINETLSDYYYALAAKYDLWVPSVFGTKLNDFGVRISADFAMLGVGGLMGIRVAAGMLLGSLLNYAVLAPAMLHLGEFTPVAGGGSPARQYITHWGLWWAVAAMVVGSMVGLLAKPSLWKAVWAFVGSGSPKNEKEPVCHLPSQTRENGVENSNLGSSGSLEVLTARELFSDAGKKMSGGGVSPTDTVALNVASSSGLADGEQSARDADAVKSAGDAPRSPQDPLAHIELPLWVSWVGIPVFGFFGAWMAHSFFGASWWLVILSVPLAALLSVIAANAMALTSWTPVGALSKITQFTMGAFDHTNAATNLSAAGMTGEIAGNAANLLSDIKPGYMLGAKPRQQACGHIIGIIAGALCSTPIFYLLFLPPDAAGNRSVATLISDQFPMPGAVQWAGVARFIQNGFSSLPNSVLLAMAIAAAAALLFEILRLATGGRWWLTGVTLGLGGVLPPDACLCMFGGALFFETAKKLCRRERTRRVWVDGVEPICAGLITGAALTGIGDALCKVLLK